MARSGEDLVTIPTGVGCGGYGRAMNSTVSMALAEARRNRLGEMRAGLVAQGTSVDELLGAGFGPAQLLGAAGFAGTRTLGLETDIVAAALTVVGAASVHLESSDVIVVEGPSSGGVERIGGQNLLKMQDPGEMAGKVVGKVDVSRAAAAPTPGVAPAVASVVATINVAGANTEVERSDTALDSSRGPVKGSRREQRARDPALAEQDGTDVGLDTAASNSARGGRNATGQRQAKAAEQAAQQRAVTGHEGAELSF